MSTVNMSEEQAARLEIFRGLKDKSCKLPGGWMLSGAREVEPLHTHLFTRNVHTEVLALGNCLLEAARDKYRAT